MWVMVTLAALIQGLTEFLPVSSSGHLRLLQHWFDISEPQTFFDLCLHVGTLFAVVVFYRERLLKIVKAIFARLRPGSSQEETGFEVRLFGLLVAGTIPTGIIGVALGNVFETHLSSIFWVGVFLGVTGLILWWTRGKEDGEKTLRELSFRDALIVGTVQGFAVLRGISRSGSTIAMGVGLGLRREDAAELSFLLSIPAILGAVTLKGLELIQEGTVLSMSGTAILLGTLLSGVVGYLALRLLLKVIDKGNLYRFAPYCWAMSALALLSSQ